MDGTYYGEDREYEVDVVRAVVRAESCEDVVLNRDGANHPLELTAGTAGSDDETSTPTQTGPRSPPRPTGRETATPVTRRTPTSSGDATDDIAGDDNRLNDQISKTQYT